MNPPPNPDAPTQNLVLPMSNCGRIELSSQGVSGQFHAISLPLWDALTGFHRLISLDHQSESVTYHRWVEADKVYHTMIPFQKGRKRGLSVSVDWQDKRNIEMVDRWCQKHQADWFPACTIHTHVDSAAFESGTDFKDEEHWPGWHLTMGHLLSHPEYHLAARLRLPKRPEVTKLAQTDEAWEMGWEHLFRAGVDRKRILCNPGTTDWAQFTNRISF